jgi:hypothetical protein
MYLGGEQTEKIGAVQDAESTQMIYDLMNYPKYFKHHSDGSLGAVILATVLNNEVEFWILVPNPRDFSKSRISES